MQYKYKMIQAPPNISVNMRDAKGQEAAKYLEEVVSKYAQNGWEFYRVDSLGVTENPGCLAGLAGQKAVQYLVYVITFRKRIA